MRERISLARCASRPILRLFIAFLVIGVTANTSLFAQPANDDCSSAAVAPVNGTCFDGNNTLATPDIGNGSCAAGGAGAANVWIQFTAQGADYDISGFGLGNSVELTLIQFQGTACTFADAVEFDCGPGNIANTDALMAGSVYYLMITSSSGAEGNYSICIDNPMDPPPPPNDDPCAAQPTPPNGACSSGTTVNATTDWSNPNCGGLGENSVWYSVTLAAGSNAIDVDLGSGDITGQASMMIGQFATDCTGGFSFVGQYCGPPNTTLNVPGLTGGQTYYIVVSTEEANAGTFDICVTEIGANPACAPNDPCSGAFDISGVPVQNVCAQGCTDGVSPDNTGGAGCSDFSGAPTVWYSFTTDATTALVSLSLSSPDFDQGQVALFQGSCGGFAPVDCNIGAGGSVELQNVAVMPNTSYLVAVASLGGEVGSFNLCALYQGAGGTNCITSGDVVVTNTSLGSPPSGPFLPNETVSFCLNVNWTSSGNNCQWLHGIVPEFGECWSDASFDASTGMPIAVSAPLPNSNWYTDGEVTYNDIPSGALPFGAPVGAGWFVVGINNNGNLPGQCPPGAWAIDPNCSYGVPMNCNASSSYAVCFDLTTKSFAECDADPASINCGVSFKTYGDGETGGWGSAGCEADIPIIGNYSLNCCIGPELTPSSFTACSDVQIDIFLEDLVLPPSDPFNLTYSWVANAPAGVTGASSCMSGCPSVISQILVNTTGAPQIVTYEITAESLDGCPGVPTTVAVEVLPSIMPSINQPDPVCSGQCVQLFGSATGGDGNYTYEWDNFDTGLFTEVCPSFTTTYGLTVTDGNGCTGVGTVTVEANPNFDVVFFPGSYDPICEGEPQPPLTAIGTIGSVWMFNWELPGPPFNSQSPIITPTYTQDSFYYVTLTDVDSGCTGEGEIVIPVNPAPVVIAWSDEDEVCQSDTPINILGGIPTGGTWTGNVNADNWFIPNTPGVNTITYNFTDGDTGCSGSFDVEITVLPTPETPVFQPANTDLCQGATATFCVDAVNGATEYAWNLPAGVTFNGVSNASCIEVVWGSASGGNICVMGVNDCGDGPQECLAITINPTPPEPGAITGLNPVCLDADGVTYSIAAVTGATSYTWQVTGGTFTGSGTSITVDWGTGASGEICVTAANACGDGPPHCETINFDTPPTDPGLPTGLPACDGELGVAYTTTGSPGATSYTWQVTGGTIASGDGTDMITVDWGTGGGQVCVTAVNDCGSGNQVCTAVVLNSVPANAGPINGLDLICQNTNGQVYTVGTAAGADTYTWSVPPNVTIVSGQGTQTLTVDFGIFTAGQICVEAFNDCGPSNPSCFDVTPELVPLAPGQLPDDVHCAGATDITYTVNVAGATGYNWTLPPGVTAITGVGTGTIGFNLGTATSGPICVTAINDCGEGPQMCFNIEVNDVPDAPTNAVFEPVFCEGANNENYSIDPVTDADSYVWTVPAGASITSGQGTTSITVDWGTVLGGQICVAGENQCGIGEDLCFNVTADQPLADPTILCDLDATSLTEVGFTITHPIATDFTYYYTVNGGALMGPVNWTSNPVLIPAGANEDVEIFVTALGNGNFCGDSAEASWICTANDCDNNPPTIDAPTSQFCPDSPGYQLTANPSGGTYSGTDVSATGFFTPSGSGDVIVTYQYNDANMCPQTNTITLTVNDFPIAEAGDPGIISCSDPETQIFGAGSSTGADIEYEWSGPGVLAGTANDITATVNQTGIYTLVVTNTVTGCSASDVVEVDPDSSTPTGDAGGDQLITCDDPIVTLMGSGANGTGLTYLWTGPGINGTNETEPQPMVSAIGLYTLVVTAGNGCSSSPVDVNVTQALDPVAMAGNGATFFCETDSLLLDATVGTTTGVGIEYQWSGPGNISGANSLNPWVDAAGTYTLLVTDTNTGCTDMTTVDLPADIGLPTATPNPTATITCFVPMPALQGAGSAINMDFLWTGPGITALNENDQNPVIDVPGTYYLTVIDQDNGCTSAPAEVIVDMAQDPVAEAGDNSTLTCAFPTTDLSGAGSDGGPNISYLWTGPGTITNPTTLAPTVDIAGTFTLTVTNNVTGCTGTDEVILSPDINAPTANAGADQNLTCLITSVQLMGSATNGTNIQYTWTGPGITPANENDQNPVVSVDGEYFLSVLNIDNGCPSAGVSVMVNPPPIVEAMATGALTYTCAIVNGLQLDGTGTTTGPDMVYLWTGGTIDNATTLMPTVYGAGTYTLTATNSLTGCAETASHTIAPDLGAPIVTASPQVSITCDMGTVNLSVTTDATTPLFTWTGPGITPGNMNMQNITVSEPGMYFIQVEDDINGCDNSDQVEVLDMTADPMVNAGTNVVKNCTDLTVDLDAITGTATGAGITYLWTGPGVITNETTLTPTVSEAGTFVLTVTNTATGCSDFASVEVEPDINAPVAMVNPDDELDCNNNFEFTLQGSTTSSSTNLLWTWTGPGITPANANMQNPTVTVPGFYELIILDQDNGCDGNVASVNLTQATPPVAEINSGNINTIDCFTDNLTMVAVGCDIDPNLLIEWYLNGTLQDDLNGQCEVNFEQGQPDGLFQLVVIDDLTGCADTAEIMIMDNTEFPGAMAGDDDALDCEDTEIQLVGTSLQTTGVTYLWSGPQILTDPTLPTITVGAQGNYTLEVTETLSGCVNSDEVFVDDLTAVPLAGAGDDQELDCVATPVEIGTPSGGTGLTYTWLNESNEVVGTTAQIMVSEVGNYTLEVFDPSNNCPNSDFVVVSPPSDAPVDFDLLVDNPDCPGDENGFINVLAVTGGTQPFTYTINDIPMATPLLTGLAPGTYNLLAEDANECQLAEVIIIPPAPETEVDLGNNVELEWGDSTTVTAQISVPLSDIIDISWFPANAVECLNLLCDEVKIKGDVPSMLKVQVTTASGCVVEDNLEVRVEKDFEVYFPNVFSPSGDGLNDFFRPYVNNDKVARIENFIIADRWGEIVFNAPIFDFLGGDELGWDGNLRGRALNPAVFVYYARVTFIDGSVEEFSGDVTLLR